jgi:hypothetical protein
MRLNKLQRLGIILSVLWALGMGIHTHNSDVDAANNFAKHAYKVCTDSKSLEHNNDLSSCAQEREKNLATWLKGDVGNTAFAALAPIPFFWLFAFILLYIGCIQIVGFQSVVQWRNLNKPKKAIVLFCSAATAIAVLFELMVIMNLYVDTEVPVALATRPKIIKLENQQIVVAEGTWVRSGDTPGSAVAYPLQTSKIQCSKLENRCIETQAYVSGNLLETDMVTYDIQSWTADSIVFVNDSFCSLEIYSIDFNTEAVTGAGHPTHQDTPLCKLYPSGEKKWSYELSDGFKVYWEQRQKARPFLLRLIQSLFGN